MLMKVPAQEEESWNRDFSCAEKEIGEGKSYATERGTQAETGIGCFGLSCGDGV